MYTLIRLSRLLYLRFVAVSICGLFSVSLVVAAERTMIFQAEPEPSSPVNSLAPPKTVKQPNTANAELFFIVQSLQKEVRELRGLLEEQGYQIRQLQKSGKDRYKDLDSRILDLSKQNSEIRDSFKQAGGSDTQQSKPLSVPVSTPAPVAVKDNNIKQTAVVSAEPSKEQEREYQKAYSLVKQRKFAESVDAFQAFVEKYPKGDLTANAYYWLGEVYLVLPKLEQARQAFTVVVNAYPEHRKAPDALLKLGVTYQRMQNTEQAKSYFNKVISSFPDSTAAKLAKSYLSKI